ncbi:hypothetical protein [Vibrio parahaemolyticus]|uniref:hypothetical protein n=1 Tax=Vibrio parahaemolyticus TaxID=670 RepID=UPI0011241AB3|nr:hypothetical protein [Vibrio parahaemolyticus]TPB41791.1 hypothetical protein DXJ78_24150 [Vibrio parahaemolyticus]
MTQNIEQRTETAVKLYEKASASVYDFSNSENEHFNTPSGSLKKSLEGIINDAARAVSGTGGLDLGDYTDNVTIRNYNEYVVFNRDASSPNHPTQWKVFSGDGNRKPTPLPYKIDSLIYPNPQDDPNLQPYSDINKSGVERIISGSTKLSFKTLSDIAKCRAINHQVRVKVGDTLSVEDYAEGHESGTLFFRVVPEGTGVHDGGKYIDIPELGVQLQQNLKYPYSLKAWGASRLSTVDVNNNAFSSVMDFAINNRKKNRFTTIFDLGGDSIEVSQPVVIRSSGFILRNGTIIQTVNNQDCMQSDGSEQSIYYLELDHVGLSFSEESSAKSGVNFRHLTGTLGWFKWKGLSAIMSGGEKGFSNGYGTKDGVDGKKGGPIWMLEMENLWFDKTWSSSVFIPSNGGEFSLTAFDGGSTTQKLSNVHTTNIRNGDPAYCLGNGIDHLTLDNVTADHCTKFGAFKAKTLIIRNIAMEEIRPPFDIESRQKFYSESEHNLVQVGQQQSLDLSGFTTAFGEELKTTPHADTNHVALDSVNAKITGIIGGTVSTGRALRVNGGTCIVNQNNVPGALPDRVMNGARVNYQTQQRIVSKVARNNTFTLFPVDPSMSRAYLITLLYEYGGFSSVNTFICHTSGTLGGLKGNTALLLGAIDFKGASLSVNNGNVEATVPSNTYVNWTAVDLTKL